MPPGARISEKCRVQNDRGRGDGAGCSVDEVVIPRGHRFMAEGVFCSGLTALRAGVTVRAAIVAFCYLS